MGEQGNTGVGLQAVRSLHARLLRAPSSPLWWEDLSVARAPFGRRGPQSSPVCSTEEFWVREGLYMPVLRWLGGCVLGMLHFVLQRYARALEICSLRRRGRKAIAAA